MESRSNDYFEDLVQHLFLDIDYENAAIGGLQMPGGAFSEFDLNVVSNNVTTNTTSNSMVEKPVKKSNGPAPAPAPIALPEDLELKKRDRSEISSLGGTEDDLVGFTLDAKDIQFSPSALRKKQKTGFSNRQRNRKAKTESSEYIGVCFYPAYGRYRARIKVNGKTTHLGYFETAYQAALAYDRAAYELRGESAVTNFPIADYLVTGGVVSTFKEPGSPRSRCLAAARSVRNPVLMNDTEGGGMEELVTL